MRKLLSLLAISATAGSSTINVVSCRKKTVTNKKDLKEFEAFMNNKGPIIINDNATAGKLYNAIQVNLATFANNGASAEDINKENSGVTITITQGENETIKHFIDNDDVIYSGIYRVTIIADKNNKWFNETPKAIDIDVALTIPGEQVDISGQPFANPISYSTNADIYNEIRKQLAGFARGDVSVDDIKNDENIAIDIYQTPKSTNEDIKVNENDPLATDASKYSYKLTLTIGKNDPFFKETENNHPLTLLFNKVNITTKTFTNSFCKTGADLYNLVRTQITNWISIQGVSTETIKDDISITDGANPIPDDKTNLPEETDKYTITTKNSDNYYIIKGSTEITVHVLKDADSFQIRPNPNDRTKSLLYDTTIGKDVSVKYYDDTYFLGWFDKDIPSDEEFTKAWFKYDSTISNLTFISNDDSKTYIPNYIYENSSNEQNIICAPENLPTKITISLIPTAETSSRYPYVYNYMIVHDNNTKKDYVVVNNGKNPNYKLTPINDNSIYY